jgi:TRAP transporter TAXI family solute receptor
MKGWMALFAGAVAALSVATGVAQEKKVHISIVTGGTGGVYYPLGQAIAGVITRHVAGVEASTTATGGSVANVQMIDAGRATMGFAMADSAWDAYQGLDRFAVHKVALRTLAVFYPNRMHVVTLEGTGITRFADLKGRRVSTGAPASGTEIMALRLMEAEGLDAARDVVASHLSVAESVAALQRGDIDAFFWVGGAPTPSITELASASPRQLRLIDHGEAAERMRARFGPIYMKSRFLPNVYPGQKAESSNVDVWNLLVVPADADERLVYELTRAIFEHRDELAKVHKDAAMLDVANQTPNASPIPYHPGALRYFRERSAR